MTQTPQPVVACFATQGRGSLDERRIHELLKPLSPVALGFDRSRKGGSALGLWRELRRVDPQLVVMEGTGLAGGLVLLAGRLLSGRPYIVSSGDAVGPFLRARSAPLGLAGSVYERLLCRLGAGFIGWTPYLVGRALTFGAPRAMTAPNWGAEPAGADAGAAVRERLGIPPDAIVFGLVGALNWTARHGYCYGQELVRARCDVDREEIHVLVVGDGDGRSRLQALAGPAAGVTIHLPGRVEPEAVPAHLAAMDVASLPQSVDGVGSFRYSTKVSEYRAAGLPIVTGQIPLGYDLDPASLWRLPGDAPWDATYVRALAQLMTTVDATAIAARRPADADAAGLFDRDRQQRQVCEFVRDVARRERERRGASIA